MAMDDTAPTMAPEAARAAVAAEHPQHDAPVTDAEIQHVAYTDEDLTRLAQDNLADAAALTQAVSNAIDEARKEKSVSKQSDALRRALDLIGLEHQSVVATTRMADAAANLLQVRVLEGIARQLDRIAGVLERAEELATKEMQS